MWPAFPTSQYYGGSATTRYPQRASRLPPDRLAAEQVGRYRIASHVHWCPFRRGSASGYTPVASPRAAHHSLGPGLPPPKSHRRQKRTGQKPRPVQHHEATHPPDSPGRRRLTGLPAPVQFPYAFSSSLAGTSRLAVPTRPYIVEAASSLAPNPGSGLPPASTDHCDDRRRVPPPARLTPAPRGARLFSSTLSTTAASGGFR